jgi:hypothetical protein
MMTPTQVRALVEALPEAIEQDHHGFPSFRVRGKIFATLPNAQRLNVFIDLDELPAVLALASDACHELRWGRQVRGVSVLLQNANRPLVARLLSDAWRRKAPRSLVKSG